MIQLDLAVARSLSGSFTLGPIDIGDAVSYSVQIHVGTAASLSGVIDIQEADLHSTLSLFKTIGTGQVTPNASTNTDVIVTSTSSCCRYVLIKYTHTSGSGLLTATMVIKQKKQTIS